MSKVGQQEIKILKLAYQVYIGFIFDHDNDEMSFRVALSPESLIDNDGDCITLYNGETVKDMISWMVSNMNPLSAEDIREIGGWVDENLKEII